jgi:hypothetical protein
MPCESKDTYDKYKDKYYKDVEKMSPEKLVSSAKDFVSKESKMKDMK